MHHADPRSAHDAALDVQHALHNSPLGQHSPRPQAYDPALLYPIARAPQRSALGLGAQLPFMGADLWTAFELSWLNPRGKPVVALATFTIPCETPCLVESKSFKLYLNSLADTRWDGAEALRQTLVRDLNAALWGEEPVRSSVGLQLIEADAFEAQQIAELPGVNLDRLDIEITPSAEPTPQTLSAARDEAPVHEVLCSRLLKSNCPVTGQPDWASVQIDYFGPQIDQAGLLAYLISYRQHNGFHEACVERIFMDIWQRCQPHRLSVYARYTRRGGLDINPFRTSAPQAWPTMHRTARQ